MEHDQAIQLLPGYIDEELTLSESLEFERHMAQCDVCQQAYERERQVRAELKQADLRFDAPDELTRRIKAALPLRRSPWQRLAAWLSGANAASGANGTNGTSAWKWAPAGAVAVSVAALVASAGLFVAAPAGQSRLTEELVDSHVRSLQVGHLNDVISTDRHTVKPWFDGKIDFAPPVVDLKDQGYPLTGGRLDYLDGHAVAVMVYHYRLHPINLYVWPGNDGGAPPPKIIEKQGYHVAHWSANGMNYWAITDAGQSELQGFVGALIGRAG